VFRGKIAPDENFAPFYVKLPRNRFFEKHVSGPNFFTKRPPHLFSGPNGLCGVFRGKIVPNENFAHFCLKRPQNRFSEKHVSGPNSFTKPPPHIFLGPNGLFDAFQGRIVSDENFAHVCLKHYRNRFSQKHVSGPKFFTKPPPHLFPGPNGLCGAFQGKLSQTKTSLAFA
jgi:hypothetical protein